MEKVNCLITLSNNENTTNDYLTVHHDPDKKTIFYEEKDKTTVTYNYETNTLKRDNNDMLIEYQFILNENTTNPIYIKELKNTIHIELQTVKLEKTQDKLIISYKIDDNYFTFKIEKV